MVLDFPGSNAIKRLGLRVVALVRTLLRRLAEDSVLARCCLARPLLRVLYVIKQSLHAKGRLQGRPISHVVAKIQNRDLAFRLLFCSCPAAFNVRGE